MASILDELAKLFSGGLDSASAIGQGMTEEMYQSADIDPYAIGFDPTLENESPNVRANALLSTLMAGPRFANQTVEKYAGMPITDSPLLAPMESEASEGEVNRAMTAGLKQETDLMSKRARYEAAKERALNSSLEALKAASSSGTESFVAKGSKTSLTKNKLSKGSFTKSLPSIGEEGAKLDIAKSGIPIEQADFIVEGIGADKGRQYAMQLFQALKEAQAKNDKRNVSQELLLKMAENRGFAPIMANPEKLQKFLQDYFSFFGK